MLSLATCKKIARGLVFSTSIIFYSSYVYAQDTKIENQETQIIEEEEKPSINQDMGTRDLDIASGSYSGTQFLSRHKLSSGNGRNVNFWIKNNGRVSVKITINGGYGRTFAPGQSGHITAPVTYFASWYEFKAVPVPYGGNISISYRIAQRG